MLKLVAICVNKIVHILRNFLSWDNSLLLKQLGLEKLANFVVREFLCFLEGPAVTVNFIFNAV